MSVINVLWLVLQWTAAFYIFCLVVMILFIALVVIVRRVARAWGNL